MFRKLLLACGFILLTTACIPQTPGPGPEASATPDFSDIATQTAAAITTATAFLPTGTPVSETPAVPSATTLPTVTQPSQGGMQFLAYLSNGQLLVTDVTNGVQGGTTQYTLAGENDQVMEPAWSPSGEFVAFTSTAKGEPHIFYIYALGQSSPTDLGVGSAPTWSPDSQSIAYIGGSYPDNNIWITTVENPSPRQLTLESNYAWGKPVFTPDGQSLIVAGTSRDNLGASGNTNFILESLPLDGSGTRTPLPGTQPYEGMRLPYDLQFSPDGAHLAFSTSYHLSACVSPGAYFVSNPDGSNTQKLESPALQPSINPDQAHFPVGYSYAWMPGSDAIVAHGNVVDCSSTSPNPGQSIAGPQMSILGLDGSERTIIPGYFWGFSVDRTGNYIAASHHQNGFQDVNPVIEIYSSQTGGLVLSLGPGNAPVFQP